MLVKICFFILLIFGNIAVYFYLSLKYKKEKTLVPLETKHSRSYLICSTHNKQTTIVAHYYENKP